MIRKYLNMALMLLSMLMFTTVVSAANESKIKGIYLTQYSLENTAFLNHLIKNAKAAGIDTFVVDLELISKRYKDNIQLLKENNIKWVARIIMFPGGGTKDQVENPDYWQRKYKLVKQAVDWGATSIQLDYIRYNTKQHPSSQNAENVLKIIQWYKSKLAANNIPLQVDVFGIASYGESKYIGQNIKLFSQSVDAVCPMVYPSHYTPFKEHFNTPHETVYDSLASIQDQFNGKMPIKMYAYIELSNYHYPMSHAKTLDYIRAQISAVKEAGADGWYAWSPHNRYDNLFTVLLSDNSKSDASEASTDETKQDAATVKSDDDKQTVSDVKSDDSKQDDANDNSKEDNDKK